MDSIRYGYSESSGQEISSTSLIAVTVVGLGEFWKNDKSPKLGNAFMAFAVNTLIFEHGIICGGVSGLGSAAEHYFGLPVSVTVALLNIMLFFLGFWSFGKEFAMSIIQWLLSLLQR